MFSYSNLILSKKFLDYKLNFINYKLFWSTFRATKIVLQGESTAHLFDIEELAKKAHIPHYLVHDAGKTQVSSGALTVIGLFGSSSELGMLTGSLLLL